MLHNVEMTGKSDENNDYEDLYAGLDDDKNQPKYGDMDVSPPASHEEVSAKDLEIWLMVKNLATQMSTHSVEEDRFRSEEKQSLATKSIFEIILASASTEQKAEYLRVQIEVMERIFKQLLMNFAGIKPNIALKALQSITAEEVSESDIKQIAQAGNWENTQLARRVFKNIQSDPVRQHIHAMIEREKQEVTSRAAAWIQMWARRSLDGPKPMAMIHGLPKP